MMKGASSFSPIQILSSSGHFLPRLNVYYYPQGIGIQTLAITAPRERILCYWFLTHVGIRCSEKADGAAKTSLLRRVINFHIPYGDFKKHISVLLKGKW